MHRADGDIQLDDKQFIDLQSEELNFDDMLKLANKRIYLEKG